MRKSIPSLQTQPKVEINKLRSATFTKVSNSSLKEKTSSKNKNEDKHDSQMKQNSQRKQESQGKLKSNLVPQKLETSGIDELLVTNQLKNVFKFLSVLQMLQLRLVCQKWKKYIEVYFSERHSSIEQEKNDLEIIISYRVAAQEYHSMYVRAYKKVSDGHDLIFNLSKKDIESFYFLKPKSEVAKEVRSIAHQVIGCKLSEKIPKYSYEYYETLITACKEVDVSSFSKSIISRLACLGIRTDLESLEKENHYAHSLRVLLSGYFHLYVQSHYLDEQKVRLASIQEDIKAISAMNKNQ